MGKQIKMKFSIRLSYPETGAYPWPWVVQKYSAAEAVELAFYMPRSFLARVEIDDVITPLKEHNLNVSTIHMAHAPISRPEMFIEVLKKTIKIGNRFNCQTIIAHPSRDDLITAERVITNEVEPLLLKEGVILCWETFAGKNRFIYGLEGITEFCRKRKNQYVCFDFSHIPGTQNKILSQIEKLLDMIKVFHCSNRIRQKKKYHLPLFWKEEKPDLNFEEIFNSLKEKNYTGYLTLEYMPQYRTEILDDLLKIKL